MGETPRISIIIPVLNEADGICRLLEPLRHLRTRGAEVIIVDGGSTDDTVNLASRLADSVLAAPRGRSSQMNVGAAKALGRVLLFLHADTLLPTGAGEQIEQAIDSGRRWGRFDVRIQGESAWLPVVATMMNWRSRLTGIATGDQAIFVTREAFAAVGGFPDMPLMEDISLSGRLLKIGRPACLTAWVVTSGRRWERHGVWRTILLMWRLRLAYFLGADPAHLAERYGYTARKS